MRHVSKAMLISASVMIALAASPVRAETGSEEIARALKANAQSLLPGAVMMAPIPDEASESIAAEPSEEAVGLSRSAGERHCLATAIYFEARGESARGQRAVAEVIVARTRARGRPRTICGVVYEGSSRSTGCQFSFTCDGISDVVYDRAAWRRAKRVADMVARGKVRRVARGATFYHADSIMPYWASSMRKVAQIGSHIFYRP